MDLIILPHRSQGGGGEGLAMQSDVMITSVDIGTGEHASNIDEDSLYSLYKRHESTSPCPYFIVGYFAGYFNHWHATTVETEKSRWVFLWENHFPITTSARIRIEIALLGNDLLDMYRYTDLSKAPNHSPIMMFTKFRRELVSFCSIHLLTIVCSKAANHSPISTWPAQPMAVRTCLSKSGQFLTGMNKKPASVLSWN